MFKRIAFSKGKESVASQWKASVFKSWKDRLNSWITNYLHYFQSFEPIDLILLYLLLFSIFVTIFMMFYYLPTGNLVTASRDSNRVSFWEHLYFSAMTQATVVYGDYHPFGSARIFAAIQGLSGVFLNSIFTALIVFRLLRPNPELEFPDFCCFDIEKKTFVFRICNKGNDRLLQATVQVRVEIPMDPKEDQFISKRAYGIELDDCVRDSIIGTEDIWAIRTKPSPESKKVCDSKDKEPKSKDTEPATETTLSESNDPSGKIETNVEKRTLKPEGNTIAPTVLKEDVNFFLMVSGIMESTGNTVAVVKTYKFQDIRCGIYVKANDSKSTSAKCSDLAVFNQNVPTSDEHCKNTCNWHKDCNLDVKRNLLKKLGSGQEA